MMMLHFDPFLVQKKNTVIYYGNNFQCPKLYNFFGEITNCFRYLRFATTPSVQMSGKASNKMLEIDIHIPQQMQRKMGFR